MDLRFFEIYRSGEYMSLILDGALTSLGLTIAAGIAGFMVAFLLALLRFKKVPVLDRIAAGYIDFIRNTPLIVQPFFVAFGLPMLFGYVWPLGLKLETCFAWPIQAKAGEVKANTFLNWPMQAHGAEMMRIACILAVERALGSVLRYMMRFS